MADWTGSILHTISLRIFTSIKGSFSDQGLLTRVYENETKAKSYAIVDCVKYALTAKFYSRLWSLVKVH